MSNNVCIFLLYPVMENYLLLIYLFASAATKKKLPKQQTVRSQDHMDQESSGKYKRCAGSAECKNVMQDAITMYY